MRKTEFFNEEYYHIYNRGVDKREVFSCERDCLRFLQGLNFLNDEKDGLLVAYYRSKKENDEETKAELLKKLGFRNPLVEIVAYCLAPNHYHLILKQLKDKGIEKFMHKVGTSHTKFFNKKYDRSGSLFQGKYKAVHIDSNEYLLYLSAYVNMNYEIHKLGKITQWPYSSYADYSGRRNGNLCNKEAILSQFGNNHLEYEEYMANNCLYAKEKKEMEHLTLE